MRSVKVVFPKVVDVRCFSHVIDCVGDHFNITILKRFWQLWNSLFGHSAASRLAWRERAGISGIYPFRAKRIARGWKRGCHPKAD